MKFFCRRVVFWGGLEFFDFIRVFYLGFDKSIEVIVGVGEWTVLSLFVRGLVLFVGFVVFFFSFCCILRSVGFFVNF